MVFISSVYAFKFEGVSMRKIFKIILGVFAVLVIVGVVVVSLLFMDAAGNLATNSQSLPSGAAIGKALVVYDPGLSGGAKDVATKIAYSLQSAGYDVVLAGVKSSDASNLAGYSVIVFGGPIYAGKPASSIQAYIDSFNPPVNAKVGAFGYGSIKEDNTKTSAIAQEVAPMPKDASWNIDAALKAASGDNINSLCQQFITKLLH
jgi:flavodoxin